MDIPLELWAHEVFPRLVWLDLPSAVQFGFTCRAFAGIRKDVLTNQMLYEAATYYYMRGGLFPLLKRD
jgi:hypothetical protein